MTIEEELRSLREEQTILQEQVASRDAIIQQQQAWLDQQRAVNQHLQEQLNALSEQVKALREQRAKNSHNSHLPPSSERFVRKPKSLRQKSEKKSGGQPGSSLHWSCNPDEVVEQQVETCEVCHQDLHAVAVCHVERRQVLDVPPAHLIVQEYRAEHKQCPQCQHITGHSSG